MKKIFIIIMLSFIISLFADNLSISTPLGGMKISVDESSSKKKVSAVDEIADKLDVLQKDFCSKLNKLDRRRADKIIDEIYNLLSVLPSDVMVTAEVSDNNSATTTISSSSSSSNANANININMNIQDKSASGAPVVEEKPTSEEMTESQFNRLLQNVKNEGFADDQTSVVRVAAQSQFFTVNQLIRLLNVFTFASDKIEIVRIVYPRIVDKENAHNLLGAFTYSSDKKAVEQIIGR